MPGPCLCQRKPATTQSAVRACFDLDHRALARRVGRVERAWRSRRRGPRPRSARTSRAPASRSRVAGVRWTGGRAPASAAPAGGGARPAAAPSGSRRPPPADPRRRTTPGSRAPACATRDAAGWMRSSSDEKSRPPAPAITISPSSTARSRQRCAQRRLQLGEVAAQRLQVAALDVDLVAVAEHQRAKAVPLRLVQPAVALGDLGRQLREHRLDGRRDGQLQNRPPTALNVAPTTRAPVPSKTGRAPGRPEAPAAVGVARQHRRQRRRLRDPDVLRVQVARRKRRDADAGQHAAQRRAREAAPAVVGARRPATRCPDRTARPSARRRR